MKPDLRISIKDYRRKKSLKVQLTRTPFGPRQFLVRMAGKPWHRTVCERTALTLSLSPRRGETKPVSITRVMTALRKALAREV